MADHNLDEYESVKFYAENTKPKKSGFSKFQVGDKYYFCRYVDGDIAMISQAYTGKPGRDNGIESVRKNEKIASRYRFESRGKSGQGFGLRAGNGQEIAISPEYASLGKAQSVASRMSGVSFTGTGTAKKKAASKTAPKKAATKNPVAKKALAKKTRVRRVPARKVAAKKTPVRASSFTAKDGRTENYRPLSFYEKNGSLRKGFNSFEKNGAYYFHYVENGKIVLISESYTSKRGRDNGIVSVTKNMGLKSAYRYHQHKNGKHYFDLNATNGQEIATSRWYSSNGTARDAARYLLGEKTRTRTATTKKPTTKTTKAKAKPAKATQTKTVRSRSEEDNYPPLAFYRRQTKGKKKGFEKFHGDDGEYYFTYFENNKLALISEGYPTATIRDKGLASVEKNMKIEKRYVQGTGADGKPGFILRAGNHKEIARSVGYGSAAAAVAGAAYIMGTRRRPAAKPKAAKPKVTKVKKTVVKKTVVKKAAAPIKPKPKPKPKPPAKPKVKPLAAGAVAVAGLGAAAAAKANEVKKAAVPVKAAPIKVAPKPPTPIKVAPIAAAAAVGTAAVAAAAVSAPKAAPVEVNVVKAAPAAAPAAAVAAPAEGAGIWGWLKWLLLLLLGLFAAFFLFKACAGGSDNTKVPPSTTTTTAAPAAMITCWNGDKAKNDAACPTKVTCWDGSFETSRLDCPVKVEERTFVCWDGSKAVNLSGCSPKPEPKVAVAPVAPEPKVSAPSVTGRFCAPSTNPLFNASRATPVNVTRLGTNVQFGNSLSLSPNAFYARLENRYRTSARDKAFLDFLAKSLGHGTFQNMDASMFTNDTLANGTSGVLGYGQRHAVQFSTLNVTDPTHLEAFKVRSANGTDVHFMKRCGNFMYVCQP